MLDSSQEHTDTHKQRQAQTRTSKDKHQRHTQTHAQTTHTNTTRQIDKFKCCNTKNHENARIEEILFVFFISYFIHLSFLPESPIHLNLRFFCEKSYILKRRVCPELQDLRSGKAQFGKKSPPLGGRGKGGRVRGRKEWVWAMAAPDPTLQTYRKQRIRPVKLTVFMCFGSHSVHRSVFRQNTQVASAFLAF